MTTPPSRPRYRTNGAALGELRSIAVLGQMKLGDFVFLEPALSNLRDRWPEAEIVLLGAAWQRDFLGGRPSVIDRVEVLPLVPGVGAPTGAVPGPELADFENRIRSHGFDAVLQCYGGGKTSNPFVSRLGARITAGFQDTDAPALDRTTPYVLRQHEVLRNVQAATLLGATWQARPPHFYLCAEDHRRLAETVTSASTNGESYAVLIPGARDAHRRWPVDRFGALADRLAHHEVQCVVTTDASERSRAAAVVAASSVHVLDLAGRLDLGALAAILANAALVVGNDTGPLHLARAVGARTVGIFWAPNAINAGAMDTNRHLAAISWAEECPVCETELLDAQCDHDAAAVSAVSVTEVEGLCQRLLADQ